MQDLQESEGCQDELALRVQQLKAELVLFKGLMSNVCAVLHMISYVNMWTTAAMELGNAAIFCRIIQFKGLRGFWKNECNYNYNRCF